MGRIWGLVGSPSPSPGASPAPPKAWVALNSYGSLGMLHTMDMYRRIWGLVGSPSPSPGAFVASPAPHIMAWVALNSYGSLGMLHTMDMYRRQGCALSLMKATCKRVRSDWPITPVVHIADGNSASRNLFFRLGFSQQEGPVIWTRYV